MNFFDEVSINFCFFLLFSIKNLTNLIAISSFSLGISSISTFGNVKIQDNIISTLPGTTVLYLDPYTDGLSNEGTVVIKGNLQVDGTTTSVNEIDVDAIDVVAGFVIGIDKDPGI